eukprot:416617-Pyramimonas_sp.AAC.1
MCEWWRMMWGSNDRVLAKGRAVGPTAARGANARGTNARERGRRSATDAKALNVLAFVGGSDGGLAGGGAGREHRARYGMPAAGHGGRVHPVPQYRLG